jgi:hypothetical protein
MTAFLVCQTLAKVHAHAAGSARMHVRITTASGLKYVDLVVGKGPTSKQSETVVVNYTGRFTNGKLFVVSVGKKPFEFTLGRGQVTKGYDEGVGTMQVGGKRKLTIPAELAYGPRGVSGCNPSQLCPGLRGGVAQDQVTTPANEKAFPESVCTSRRQTDGAPRPSGALATL